MRKYALAVIIAAIFLAVLYVGKPIIMPFVLAVFIWYMVNILTDALAKPLPGGAKLPRPLAFCAALLTIAGAIALASWIIFANMSEVAGKIPAYKHNLEHMNNRLVALVPWSETLSLSKMIAGIDANAITRGVVGEVTGLFGKGVIVAIYLLFLFLEQGSFKGKLERLIPNAAHRQDVEDIVKRIDSDIRTYIGIKTVVSIATAILCYIVMAGAGLNFASFWAFIVFLFNYIPTFGSIVATALPTAFAFMQYESLAPFFIVLIGVGALEGLIGSVIEPRFQGDRLNLSPIVILFSLALWNMVWGIPGMFLCVPLTSIAMIVFSHFPHTRPVAVALSRTGKLKGKEPVAQNPPPARKN
jgi:predicted PurR-regulated permease PerM